MLTIRLAGNENHQRTCKLPSCPILLCEPRVEAGRKSESWKYRLPTSANTNLLCERPNFWKKKEERKNFVQNANHHLHANPQSLWMTCPKSPSRGYGAVSALFTCWRTCRKKSCILLSLHEHTTNDSSSRSSCH